MSQLPRLKLRGLMTIPEPAPILKLLALLQKGQRPVRCAQCAGLALDTLSMGMSADLEAAIHAGSTMVRVGTAIFGGRLSAPAPGADAGTRLFLRHDERLDVAAFAGEPLARCIHRHRSGLPLTVVLIVIFMV
jgi:hypothetical protein